MLENIIAYPINFIQKVSPTKNDAFDFCLVYSFFTEKTENSQKLKYIIRAEAHDDVFAIKFYAARDSKLDDKYNRILGNNGYVGAMRIFKTCASLIPLLMINYPNYSYIVNGARTIDINKRIEGESETQRFRIYRTIAAKIIGSETFEHFQFKEISSYLLVKRKIDKDIYEEKNRIKMIFTERYALEVTGD